MTCNNLIFILDYKNSKNSAISSFFIYDLGFIYGGYRMVVCDWWKTVDYCHVERIKTSVFDTSEFRVMAFRVLNRLSIPN